MPVDRPAPRRAASRRAGGFTLVELTIVMAIVGIVVGIGVSRFADAAPFRARGFASELAQTVAAAQRLAVAQRRTVHVRVDAPGGAVTLCLDAACTQPIAARPGGDPSLAVPAGVRLSGAAVATFSFDAAGRASAGAPASLRLTDASGNDLGMGITVEPGSGHVRSF